MICDSSNTHGQLLNRAIIEPPHDKATKWFVCPAKTPPSLISLHCPHEESLVPKLPIECTAKTDQTGRMPRLIVFVGPTGHFVLPYTAHIIASLSAASFSSIYCVSEKHRLCRDGTDAQARLSLRCLPVISTFFTWAGSIIVKPCFCNYYTQQVSSYCFFPQCEYLLGSGFPNKI